jgi:hypothetical protein
MYCRVRTQHATISTEFDLVLWLGSVCINMDMVDVDVDIRAVRKR